MIIANQHARHSGGIANIEDGRSRAEKRRQVAEGTQARSRDAEGGQRRRMSVQDSFHVRARAIDGGVNESFQIPCAAGSIDRRALKVVLENVLSAAANAL